MLRSIGPIELIVMLGMLLLTVIPIVAVVVIVWMVAKQRLAKSPAPVRRCQGCQTEIRGTPAFCASCGRKLA